MARRVSWVAEPACGRVTTLLSANSGDSRNGSCSYTSSPAAWICRFCSASTSAASSMTGPRATLTRIALGFIRASSRRPISLCVRSLSGTTTQTKSASPSNSSNPQKRAPSSCSSAGLRLLPSQLLERCKALSTDTAGRCPLALATRAWRPLPQVYPSALTRLSVAIDSKRRPGLTGRHDFQSVEIDVIRQVGHVEDLLGDVFGCQRCGVPIQSIRGCLVALGAHQGEFGFGHARRNVGNPHTGGDQVAAQVVTELLHEGLGGAIDVATRIRPLARCGADIDDAGPGAGFD